MAHGLSGPSAEEHPSQALRISAPLHSTLQSVSLQRALGSSSLLSTPLSSASWHETLQVNNSITCSLNVPSPEIRHSLQPSLLRTFPALGGSSLVQGLPPVSLGQVS